MMARTSCQVLALAALLCCVLSSARILPAKNKCGVKPAVTTAIAFVADSSAGMSKDQFLLHQQSFANMIGDASLIPTNSSVAVGMWVYAGKAVEVFPPTVVDSPATAQRLAGLAAKAPRIPGHTATGEAIKTATSVLQKSPLTAAQTVMFVSATRKANSGVAPSIASGDAAAKGVRVNCIAMQSLSSCNFKAGAGAVAIKSTVSTFESVLRPIVAAQSVAPKQSSGSISTLFSKYVSAVLDPSDLFSTAPEQGTVEVNPPPPPKPTTTTPVALPVTPTTPVTPVTPTVTPTTPTTPTTPAAPVKTEGSVTAAPPPSPPPAVATTTKLPQATTVPIVKVPNDLPNIPTDDVQISVGPPKAPATVPATPPPSPPPPPPPAVVPKPPAPQQPPPAPPTPVPGEQLSGNGLPERPTSQPVPVKLWPQKPYRPRRYFPARVCGCGSSGAAARSSTFAPSPEWALALAGQPVASARQLLAYKRLLTKRRFEALLNSSVASSGGVAPVAAAAAAVPSISPFDNPECVCNRSATRLPTIYVLSPHIFNNSGAIGNIRMAKEEKKPERFFYYVLHSGAEPQFSATQCLQQTMYQLQQPAAPLGDAAPPRSNMIVAPFTPRMASLCSQKADNTPATQCSPSMPCGAPGLPCCASFVEEGMHVVHVTSEASSEHSEADEDAMEDLAALLEEANLDADALHIASSVGTDLKGRPRRPSGSSSTGSSSSSSRPRRPHGSSSTGSSSRPRRPHGSSSTGSGGNGSTSRPRRPSGSSSTGSGSNNRRPRRPHGSSSTGSSGSSGSTGRPRRPHGSSSTGSSGSTSRPRRPHGSSSTGSSGRPRRPHGGSSTGRPARPRPTHRPVNATRPHRPRPPPPRTGKRTPGADNAQVLENANKYLTKGMATFDYAKLRDDFITGILSKPYSPVTFIAAIKGKNSKGERYSQMEVAANIYLWALPDEECPTSDSKKLKTATKFAIAAFRLRRIVGVRALKRLYFLVMNGQRHGAPAFSSDPAVKSFAAALISALGASAQSKKTWQNMVRAKMEQKSSVFLAEGLKLLAFSKSKKIVSADSKKFLTQMFNARGDPLTFIQHWADNNDAKLFANWNSQASANSARPWNPSAHPALDARARNVQETMFKTSFGEAFAAIRKEYKTVESFGQAAAAAAASGDDAVDGDSNSGTVAAVQTRNQMMQKFKAQEKQFFATNPVAKKLVGTKPASTGGEYTIIKKQRFQRLLQNVDKLYKPALEKGKQAFARKGGLKTAERSLTIAAAKAAFYGPLIVQKAPALAK